MCKIRIFFVCLFILLTLLKKPSARAMKITLFFKNSTDLLHSPMKTHPKQTPSKKVAKNVKQKYFQNGLPQAKNIQTTSKYHLLGRPQSTLEQS